MSRAVGKTNCLKAITVEEAKPDWDQKIKLIVSPYGRIIDTLGDALDVVLALPDSRAKMRVIAILEAAATGLCDPAEARAAVASLLFK